MATATVWSGHLPCLVQKVAYETDCMLNASTVILLALSTEQLAAVLIALIIGLTVATIALRKRRRTVWQQFARRHRLIAAENDAGPLVTGMIRGHRFVLEVTQESSDTGALGVEEVRMALELKTGLPQRTLIQSAVGWIGDLDQSLHPEQVSVGKPEFDRNLMVFSDHAEFTRNWLTERRQHSLLKLAMSHPDQQMTCDSQQLTLQTRDVISRPEQLHEMLTSLLTTADALLADAQQDATISNGIKE